MLGVLAQAIKYRTQEEEAGGQEAIKVHITSSGQPALYREALSHNNNRNNKSSNNKSFKTITHHYI